jgi:hypothetical protein
MTVRELLGTLQRLPRDAELLAMEAGCQEYCEREVDEIEWQGGNHPEFGLQKWPHSWSTYGLARPAETPVSTAVRPRSMVRMRPVLRLPLVGSSAWE